MPHAFPGIAAVNSGEPPGLPKRPGGSREPGVRLRDRFADPKREIDVERGDRARVGGADHELRGALVGAADPRPRR